MNDHISEEPDARVIFSNKTYDRLKWVAQVALPALALFYISVAPLWGLPKQEEVTGTIVALDLLLGALLGLSHIQYKKSDARFDGAVTLTSRDDGNTNLNVQLDPKAVAAKAEVLVKVVDLQ
jgi:hypothetical protein